MKTITITTKHLNWLLDNVCYDLYLCDYCPAHTKLCDGHDFSNEFEYQTFCIPRIKKALRKACDQCRS